MILSGNKKPQHVDIVDHQVVDHTHIPYARVVGAHPLKIQTDDLFAAEYLREHLDRGVEPLPHGRSAIPVPLHPPMRVSVPLRRRLGDGLFQQYVQALIQCPLGDGVVADGGS